jgi:hypothetical protein
VVQQRDSAGPSFPLAPPIADKKMPSGPHRRHLVPVPAITSAAALSDYKFYLFFTVTVHFGDALVVYLPRHP